MHACARTRMQACEARDKLSEVVNQLEVQLSQKNQELGQSVALIEEYKLKVARQAKQIQRLKGLSQNY